MLEALAVIVFVPGPQSSVPAGIPILRACRAPRLTQITLGSRIGSEHTFALRIRDPNIILNRGSRSDLIPNTPTLSELINQVI